MLESWKNSWLKRTDYEKCYFIAFWILSLSLVVFIKLGEEYKDIFYTLFALSAGLGVFGVFIWSAPIVRTGYLLGKLKDSVLNCTKGIIAIAAIGYSRMYVSEALGLPPNDFELTVGALAILIGYLMWVLVFVFLAYAMGVLLLIYGALTGFVGNTLATLMPTLNLFFDPTKTRAVLGGLNKESSNYMGHSFGVIALVLTGLSFIQTGEMVIKNNLRLIRLLAYVLDYQNPKQYPLVKPNMRFRLHDNGIVSYAERNGWDVKITVGEIPK